MTSLGEASGPRLSRLGRYELITQIGQGGMAEVQLAIQRGPAGFEKLVVVKLVHANLATQKAFVDMLLDEARMAAMLKHPNVVDIYDLGEADGRYFIAMEYLEGEPLLAVLRAGREGKRLDPLSTARLISDTAEGLEAAHELRTMGGEAIELVHHDVSLGNIVILYNGQVKLVDFGVAKATSAAGPRAKVQGKFSYMAPEKLKGDSGDRRSDIWSLGCVLWEALTLRRLFKGGNDADTMRQVLENPIAKPSVVNGDVHPDFDPIVMKALERDPANRYATAKAMAQDLEEVLREHKYGGKNDLIAKYMQTTFESHIVARKKLLQEVSSKGRASADVLEAAFDEPQVASGSPITHSGEFAVKFRQPTSDITAGEEPSGGGRPRSISGLNQLSPASQVLAPLPRTARPTGQLLSQPYEPEASQVLAPLPRSARPSGQLLSQPYEPEAVLPGGGTTANAGNDRTKLLVIGGIVAFVAIAITIFLMFGGDPKAKAPEGPVHGTAGSVEVVAPAGSGPSAVVTPAGSAATAGSAVAAPPAAGSDPAVGSAAGSAHPGSGSTAAAGSADHVVAEEDEADIEMGADTGSSATKTAAPRPPKLSAQELFKTGMQSFVKGDSRTAVGAFRRAVQAQPGYATAWRALGLAHEKLGEFGQAKTALQRYLQLAPSAADATQIREKIGSL